MRIAVLTPTFNHYSGIDRVVQEQAESFSKQGHKVTVFALQAKISPKGYKVRELGMPGSPLKERLYRLFFFLDGEAMRKYRLLKGFDQVISHFYPMNWLARKAKKEYGCEYIYWDHGLNAGSFRESPLSWLYMRLMILFNNHALRDVDKAYSVSKFLSRELFRQSGIKSEVRYNRIDKKRFNKRVTAGPLVKRHDLDGKTVFLYVGRLAPHKGIHLLIQAFREVKERIPGSLLLIAGKPTFSRYHKKLQEMSPEGVMFTGFVKDEELPNYYGACDVYVTASSWEGFDLPAAEAQACGKPVVAFDIGSHPEIVKKGRLVREGDVKAFAKAMIAIARK